MNDPQKPSEADQYRLAELSWQIDAILARQRPDNKKQFDALPRILEALRAEYLWVYTYSAYERAKQAEPIPLDVPTWKLTMPWLVPPIGHADLLAWFHAQLELKDPIRRGRETHRLDANPLAMTCYSKGADAAIDAVTPFGFKSAVYPGKVPPEITWEELQAVYRDLYASMVASNGGAAPADAVKPKGTRKGAPVQYDATADQKIVANWQAAKVNGSTRAEFARETGQALEDVKAAIGRHGKRRNKSAE